jgi:hypothetical protein
MREVEKLVLGVPGIGLHGSLPQEIYLKVWIAQRKQKNDVVAVARALALEAAWKERDDVQHKSAVGIEAARARWR